MMGETPRDPYRVSLSASAERVRCGHSVLLRWKAIGVDSPVASVHLTTGVQNAAYFIESVAAQGVREVIFEQTGVFEFCLIVTFGNGAKDVRTVKLMVDA